MPNMFIIFIALSMIRVEQQSNMVKSQKQNFLANTRELLSDIIAYTILLHIYIYFYNPHN